MLTTAAPETSFDPRSLDSWLDWAVGTPLHLLLIALCGTIALVALRRVIRTAVEHIADGSLMNRRGLRELGSTDVGASLLRANPLASARRAQRARTIGSVLRSTTTIVVGAIVVLMMLDEVGVNIMPLLASAGVAGVALGFGAQSLVKDFLSGTFMLLEDQYGVGDTVTFGEVSGTVESVALRVTKVRDINGTLWYVRNGEIVSVGNRTQGWARAIVEVQLRPDADFDEARRLLARAGRTVQDDAVLGRYLQEDPEVIGIETLTATSALMKLQAKTEPAMQWEVARALREAVWVELDAADIPLAPQQPTVVVNEQRAPAAPTRPTPPAPAGRTAQEVAPERQAEVRQRTDGPQRAEGPQQAGTQQADEGQAGGARQTDAGGIRRSEPGSSAGGADRR